MDALLDAICARGEEWQRNLAATRVRTDDSCAMTLHIELPESIARQVRDLAAREHITLNSLIAAALTAQLDHVPHGPTIAEHAARVHWQRVDEILARVPAAPPVEGDEK